MKRVRVEECLNLVSKAKIQKMLFEANVFVLRNGMRDMGALNKWSLSYFANEYSSRNLPVKLIKDGAIETSSMSMRGYHNYLLSDEYKNDTTQNIYCHDVPLLRMWPELRKDVNEFYFDLLPKLYREKWYNYVQFFLGSSNNYTPLHFDCLLTNNLFFQTYGKKKFVLYPFSCREYFERYDWRWFRFDPQNPDYSTCPQALMIEPTEVILEAGDILFLPGGTLHYVKNISDSISFNIDFHTKRTVAKSMIYAFKGMPLKNIYYNIWCLLGLTLKVPEPIIYRFYRTYLNYVS